jgi:NAD+ kinase
LFKSVGIHVRPDKEEALKLAAELYDYTKMKGLEVRISPELAKFINRPDSAVKLQNLKTDFIIAVGGDGTILNICMKIPRPDTPILSVNMGTKGFLTEVSPNEARSAIDRCLEEKFTLEESVKISTMIGNRRIPDALNDVLITVSTPSKMLHLEILKDGARALNIHADGVLLATPIGSTGYSLSAGGSALDSTLEAFILTPLFPLEPTRPIVFSDKGVFRIKLLKARPKALIIVDGTYQEEVSPDDQIILRKSDKKAAFIRFEEHFPRRLRSRLAFAGEEYE